MAKKVWIGLVAVCVLIASAGGLAMYMLATKLDEQGQNALVALMHDVIWHPEQSVPALAKLKSEDRFGYALVKFAYTRCLSRLRESAIIEYQAVEGGCKVLPSPTCAKRVADQYSAVEAAQLPMLALDDPDGYPQHPIAQLHAQRLPLLRSARDASENLLGAPGSNRRLFIEQQRPRVQSACS